MNMNIKRHGLRLLATLVFAALSASPLTYAAEGDVVEPLMIQEQGSFAVGGTVIQSPGTFDTANPASGGQTLHGDHARVFYQVPVFLRRQFATYLIDQPRRGAAGRGTVGGTVSATPDEQRWFNTFRVGVWPDYFPGVQFSRSKEALEQYFRAMTPDTGPIDVEVNSDAVSALFDRIGPGVLVTHSHSGGMGWLTAMKNPRVRAIVSYEPGSGFVFPEGEVPPAMASSAGALEAVAIPQSEFVKLTKIPIIIYYGDFIPEEPMANPGQDGWRVRLAMAKRWTETINRHGGDAKVVHLPEIGIRGNTHFPFSDLNNVQIADLMSEFLAEKHLD